MILLLGIGYLIYPKPTKSKLNFADLYLEPTYPDQRGGDLDSITRAIILYRNGEKHQAKSMLKSFQSTMSDYWLAEQYLQEQKGDSVFMYIHEANVVAHNRDRINYIHITAYYLNHDSCNLDKAIKNLPLDTDKFYKKIYAKF